MSERKSEHDFHAMTTRGININAKTSPARTLNPVSTTAERSECTERPHRGHTERCARVLDDSSVESAIVVLLAFLRESILVVKRCKCLALAFIAADFEQLLACGVLR